MESSFKFKPFSLPIWNTNNCNHKMIFWGIFNHFSLAQKRKSLHNFKTKLCHSGHSAQQEWLFHYLRFRDCFAISWLYSYSTTLRSKGLVTSCACWNFFFGQNSRQLAPGKNYRPMWSETRRRQHPLTSKKFFLNSKNPDRNILVHSWINLNNNLEFFGFPIIFISVWKSDHRKKDPFCHHL